MNNQKTIYRDLNLDFRRNPLTNDVAVFVDSEAVRHSLLNLIQLRKYEKPFNSELYSSIYNTLFENVSPLERSVIEESVARMIKKYEPRIQTIEVRVGLNTDSNFIYLYLTYSILNIPKTFELTAAIQRTR
jgi:phage baseplate assembly protein W